MSSTLGSAVFQLHRYPLSRLVACMGGWLLLFVVRGTNNPVSQLLNISPWDFAVDAKALDYVVAVGGPFLIFVLAFGLLVFGIGVNRTKSALMSDPLLDHLFKKPQLDTPQMLVAFILLFALVRIVGELAALFLPATLIPELPLVLADFQFELPSVGIVVAAQTLFRLAFHLLVVLVPLSLAEQSGALDMLGRARWIAVGLWLFVVGTLSEFSPLVGRLAYCALAYGPSRVLCGWYFLRSGDYVRTVLFAWVAEEVLGFVLFALL